MKAQRMRFGLDGAIIVEDVLAGDRGQQLSLLPLPGQTGEGLAVETAGPLFAKGKGNGETELHDGPAVPPDVRDA